jgi:DNA-binding MarR family transcriptional regulator
VDFVSKLSAVDQLSSSSGYVLYRLGVAIEAVIEQALEPLGLQGRHFRVLAFIHDGEYSQQELSRLSGLDRTTMVAVVDALERHGLARREHNLADRRKHQVLLTQQGAKALRDGLERLGKAERAFLDPLRPAEQRQLHDFIVRLFVAHDPSCRTDVDSALS